MLVLKADSGIVIRCRVPQATASDLHSLILHLPNGNLYNNLVTWNIQRRLAFFLNLICDILAQSLELISKVCPLFHPLFIDFSFELSVENFFCNELRLGRVELFVFFRSEMIGWQDDVGGLFGSEYRVTLVISKRA